MKPPHALLAAALLLGAPGCAEEVTDADAITCGPAQPLRAQGMFAGRTINYTRSEANGNLASDALTGERFDRRVVFDLGLVPADPDDPQSAPTPLIISLQSNASHPNGASIAENINRSLRDNGDTFTVVNRPLDQLCDPTQGELCVRVGLDQTSTRELTDQDGDVHPAASGTVTVTAWTSTRIQLRYDLQLDPALLGGAEGGTLSGCADVAVGLTQAGREPLKVLGP
jgi:hypothetical protein